MASSTYQFLGANITDEGGGDAPWDDVGSNPCTCALADGLLSNVLRLSIPAHTFTPPTTGHILGMTLNMKGVWADSNQDSTLTVTPVLRSTFYTSKACPVEADSTDQVLGGTSDPWDENINGDAFSDSFPFTFEVQFLNQAGLPHENIIRLFSNALPSVTVHWADPPAAAGKPILGEAVGLGVGIGLALLIIFAVFAL